MKKIEVKSKKNYCEISDLQIETNDVFEVELYYENEFVDRKFLMAGSRLRFYNLYKGDKVVIKVLS